MIDSASVIVRATPLRSLRLWLAPVLVPVPAVLLIAAYVPGFG